MKKWILIPILFSLILIYTSCKKEIEFTDLQRQVFNSYQIGDSLVFERNGLDTVRLIVHNITHKFEQDKSWGSRKKYETATITLRDYDNLGYINQLVGSISISDLYFTIFFQLFEIYSTDFTVTEDMTVNNINYQNVYYSSSNYDTVWFTPNDQIIKMKSKEGAVYERIR
jgi:hypothetical protein